MFTVNDKTVVRVAGNVSAPLQVKVRSSRWVVANVASHYKYI